MGREFLVTEAPRRSTSQDIAAVEKFRVALVSVGAALFLTGAKATVGIWTGSLALISEAVHSGLDLFASLVTMFSVKAADRPPDRTHHYGHGKIESLSALFESILLALTCLWILREAIERLIHPGTIPIVNIYSYSVVLVAIAVDFYRYRALMRTARKHHSQALEADALHFYSDILSSCLVLIGLIFVSLGYPWADALAALFVVVWVGFLSLRLGKKNLDVLIDRVPEGYAESIKELTLETDGVLGVDRLRLRRSGSTIFADLRVALDRTFTFSGAHRVKQTLEKKLVERIPRLDAVVHTNPIIAPDESLDLGILNYIRSKGLQAHHLSLRRRGERYCADLHLEVDTNQSIGQAHALTQDLEKQLLKHFPEVETIQIHIEEMGHIEYEEIPWNEHRPDIVEKIEAVCRGRLGENKCHSIRLSMCGDKLSATISCLFPANLSVGEVHQRTTDLEKELRSSIPELNAILTHAEPLTQKID